MITPQYPSRREHRVLSNLLARESKVASHQGCITYLAGNSLNGNRGSRSFDVLHPWRGPSFDH
jgi:hypothetical protein